jgi:hypothetical protein
MRARVYVVAAVAACVVTGCKTTSTSATRIAQPPPAFVTETPAEPPTDPPAPAAQTSVESSAAPARASREPAPAAQAAAAPVASTPAPAPASPAPQVLAQSTVEERNAPAAIDTFLDANAEAPRPETEQAVATDLDAFDSELAIPSNERVLA